jgi:hypothetical protein
MTYYTEGQIRAEGRSAGSLVAGGAREALRKSAQRDRYDIFLSHSFRDAEIILGVKSIRERSGNSVYVDWIEDAERDRSAVTAATADRLRSRMKQSSSLVYAYSASSTESKWMPWELGYFDGHRNGEAIAIMPLVAAPNGSAPGQEYIGLYPVVEQMRATSGQDLPFILRRTSYSSEYKDLSGLVTGSAIYRRL